MERFRQARFSWVFVGLLALLCGALVVLQNHWIGELSVAERERLREGVRDALNRLSREFNNEITDACAGLLPAAAEVGENGPEKAYTARYIRWRESHDRIFSRISLVVPREGNLDLYNLDLDSAQLAAGV